MYNNIYNHIGSFTLDNHLRYIYIICVCVFFGVLAMTTAAENKEEFDCFGARTRKNIGGGNGGPKVIYFSSRTR